MVKLLRIAICIALAVFLSAGLSFAAQKKVLFVDSYHEGYAWSDGQIQGAKNVLGANYDVKVLRMDTKRNGAEEFKKAAGEKVKAEIDTWKPDVVICADDNASKYVIVPFYKDSTVPFVFCGVNWDASGYGFPLKNVTGVLEVSVINVLVDSMKKYAKGSRIGFIGKDNETDRREADNLTKKFGLQLASKFVNTFDEWKAAYTEMQDQVDMLIFINNAGIKDWNDDAAKKLTREVTKIPSGSTHDFIAPFVLIDYAKLADEQGEIAANMAIQIMNGKSPADLPITTNKKGQLYVNLAIAKKLGIMFPMETLSSAKVIKE